MWMGEKSLCVCICVWVFENVGWQFAHSFMPSNLCSQINVQKCGLFLFTSVPINMMSSEKLSCDHSKSALLTSFTEYGSMTEIFFFNKSKVLVIIVMLTMIFYSLIKWLIIYNPPLMTPSRLYAHSFFPCSVLNVTLPSTKRVRFK